MTEQEIVLRAKGGDQDAFAELVTAHQDRIYTLCLRMTGNREDAQDAAQEAFLNAWRGLASFQGGSSFSTWLYRLASNACIDLLRRRKRRQEGEAPHSLDDEEAGWPEPAAPGGGPEEELEQKERRQALERELRALPDHQREILVMRETVLSGDRGASVPGSGDGEVPPGPGAAGAEKKIAGKWELFYSVCV